MKRPTGITLLAAFTFIAAILLLLLAIGLLTAGIAFGSLSDIVGIAGGIFATIGALIAFIFALIYLVVGFGLWKGKNWARLLLLVVTGVSLASTFIGIIFGDIFFSLVNFLINIAIFWYLSQSHVKRFFRNA